MILRKLSIQKMGVLKMKHYEAAKNDFIDLDAIKETRERKGKEDNDWEEDELVTYEDPDDE